MGLPESRAALGEIKALEEELLSRRADAERRARVMIETAQAQSAEAVRIKEEESAGLRQKLDTMAPTGGERPMEDLPPGFAPDDALVEKLSNGIFESITRG